MSNFLRRNTHQQRLTEVRRRNHRKALFRDPGSKQRRQCTPDGLSVLPRICRFHFPKPAPGDRARPLKRESGTGCTLEGLDRPLEPNSILPQVLKRYTVMVGVCGEVNGQCGHLMGATVGRQPTLSRARPTSRRFGAGRGAYQRFNRSLCESPEVETRGQAELSLEVLKL